MVGQCTLGGLAGDVHNGPWDSASYHPLGHNLKIGGTEAELALLFRVPAPARSYQAAHLRHLDDGPKIHPEGPRSEGTAWSGEDQGCRGNGLIPNPCCLTCHRPPW